MCTGVRAYIKGNYKAKHRATAIYSTIVRRFNFRMSLNLRLSMLRTKTLKIVQFLLNKSEVTASPVLQSQTATEISDSLRERKKEGQRRKMHSKLYAV